jgi:hypothetical protein
MNRRSLGRSLESSQASQRRPRCAPHSVSLPTRHIDHAQLHRHALSNSKRGIAVDENGKLDDEVSVISSDQNRTYYSDRFGPRSKRLASEG